MPIRQCPNGHSVRDESAAFCPQCGQPLSGQPSGAASASPTPQTTERKRSSTGCLLAMGAVGVVLYYMVSLGGGISSSGRTPTPTVSVAAVKKAARTVVYDVLARNTEDYVGAIVQYRGKVVQVQESGSRAVLRVNVTNDDGWWEDTVWVNYSGPRLLEDDVISLWGKVRGRRTYTAVLGNSITIPELDALVVER